MVQDLGCRVGVLEVSSLNLSRIVTTDETWVFHDDQWSGSMFLPQ